MGIAERRHEYEAVGLHRADLDPDPMVQWQRWYDDAVVVGCTEPNAMVLSTVDEHGRPDARFVLVRGANHRGFTFFTNRGSVKGEQLEANPRAAVTFGWLELHRQIRARGTVTPISDDESDRYFATRPRGAQLAAWASAQSRPLADRSELEAAVAAIERRFGEGVVPRPPFWGGYRLAPDELELWQGRPNRLHDRFRYQRQGDGWSVVRLNP